MDAAGDPTPVTAVDPSGQEAQHAGPVFLQDGRRFLYTQTDQKVEGLMMIENFR